MSVSLHPPARERIERILASASSPRSVAQLAGQIGGTRRNVREALRKLEADGKVCETGATEFLGDRNHAKGWRLASKGGGR